MNIEMIPYTSDTVIPSNGKYLVKTTTESKLPGINPFRFIQANCSIVWNEKKKMNVTSVDVSNQTVLLISKEPL